MLLAEVNDQLYPLHTLVPRLRRDLCLLSTTYMQLFERKHEIAQLSATVVLTTLTLQLFYVDTKLQWKMPNEGNLSENFVTMLGIE